MTASKNKTPMTDAEREHVRMVKSVDCSVCDKSGPNEAHEPVQGLYYTSISLCRDCHRNPVMGLHGEKRAWIIRKMDEWKALNITLSRVNALRRKYQ